MKLIKQNEATAAKKVIAFSAVSSANLQTRLDASALTFTTRIIKPDGSSAAGGGAVTQPDATNATGVCYYTPGGTDLDTVGEAVLRVSATGMEPREIAFVVTSEDPYALGTTTSTALMAYAHETGRTLLGLFRRLDALLTGKATGLLSSTATFYRADGVTKAIEATQSVGAGTRETASTVGGD
jgi:hypothetical protein